MPLTSLLLFAGTEFFVSLSPGPAVLLIISQGMRFGRRASLFGALGIITGNVVYFAVSAAGLGALLIASETLFTAIKWAGAGYLIYLGVKSIWNARGNETDTPPDAPPVQGRRYYLQGVLTQLANPKAIVYFGAILPQFVDAERALPGQFLILGLVSVTVEFPILIFYGSLAHFGARFSRQRRYSAWIERISGMFLIGAGVRLALTRRG